MNKQEFYEGIKKIDDAYNTKFERDKLSLWYSKLNEMEYQEYIDKIEELITTKKYIPNIAEILDKQPKCTYRKMVKLIVKHIVQHLKGKRQTYT